MLRVPPAHAADVAVRAGADAPPVVAPPVAEVVPGAVRGIRRPVAHLVPVVPGGAEQLVGELVHVGLEVVDGLGELAATDLPGELGAVLDDERVRAQVVGPLGDRRVEAAPPVVERLPRRAVDEVEADVEARRRAPSRTTSGTRSGSCVRSSAASTCGTADCMPNETRVNPPSASRRRSSGPTESGFASVVTSAPGARPNSSRTRAEHAHEVVRRAAASASRRRRRRSRPGGSAGRMPRARAATSGSRRSRGRRSRPGARRAARRRCTC